MNEPADPHNAEPPNDKPATLLYAEPPKGSEPPWFLVFSVLAATLALSRTRPVRETAVAFAIYLIAVPRFWKRGRRLAPVTCILGVGTFTVLLGLAMPPEPCGRSTGTSLEFYCHTRLRFLGNAIEMYGIEHAGAYPPDLNALVLDHHVDDRQLACPADAVRGGVDFFYIPPAWAAEAAPPPATTTIVACDLRKNHSNGTRNVLFRSGNVDLNVREPDFQSLLALPENAAFAAALRAAEGP